MWKYYALFSALFAAATYILVKVGIKGISGNLATAIHTIVILFIAWGIVLFSGQIKEVKDISRTNLLFLVLSGIATGLSWIFYFKHWKRVMCQRSHRLTSTIKANTQFIVSFNKLINGVSSVCNNAPRLNTNFAHPFTNLTMQMVAFQFTFLDRTARASRTSFRILMPAKTAPPTPIKK